MNNDDLPLFQWRPPVCQLIPFPLIKRVGKIRDVVSKINSKTTTTHQDAYAIQADTSVRKQLAAIGMSQPDIDREMKAFWDAVKRELAKGDASGSRPSGGAA